MESIYTELVLYGCKNECARTDNVFPPYLRSAMVLFPLTTPNNLEIGTDFGGGQNFY